jgi:histidine triad (HIT) family protein
MEIDYIFDVDDAVLADMMIFAKHVAKKMERVMPCKKIGVTVIGLEVPHAHIHLIPINSVADMDFSRPKMTLPPDRLADIAEAMRNA